MKSISKMFRTNTDFLSKNMTDQYRGWCIFVVVLHHVSLRMQSPGAMGIFVNAGAKAVSMFFFLSAYGLTVSFLKRADYMDNFIQKRMLRICIPFVAVNMAAVAIQILVFHNSYSFKYAALSVFGATDITHQWFINVIILFYLFFWVSFRFFPKIAPLIVTVLVLFYMVWADHIGLGPWYTESSLGFPLGVVFGWHRERVSQLLTEHYIVTFLFGCIVYLTLMHIKGLELYWFKLFVFTFLAIMALSKIHLRQKSMQIVGQISLEIYLIHMCIIYQICSIFFSIQGYGIVVYVAVVILSAFMFNKMLNAGYRLAEGRQA